MTQIFSHSRTNLISISSNSRTNNTKLWISSYVKDKYLTLGGEFKERNNCFSIFFFVGPNRDNVVGATGISLTVKMHRVMDMNRIDSRFKILECNHGWQQSIGKRNTATTTKRYFSKWISCIHYHKDSTWQWKADCRLFETLLHSFIGIWNRQR